jgi:hypothetical protein
LNVSAETSVFGRLPDGTLGLVGWYARHGALRTTTVVVNWLTYFRINDAIRRRDLAAAV